MRLAFNEIEAEEYTEAIEARDIGEGLIKGVTSHEHLRDASIGYVFRSDDLKRKDKPLWAECILVERILQSERRWGRMVRWAILRVLPQFGTCPPDFLVLIDRHVWYGLSLAEKVALIDHELSHAWYATEEDGETQKFHGDGSPWWAIRAHDVEEFAAVVARNGLWTDELREFARSVIDRLNQEASRSRVA